MAKASKAPTEEPKAQDGAETKTPVQSVELPEATEADATAPDGKLDILLDMGVTVTVTLGQTEIPVRRLLQLGPGSVLKLDKPINAPAELYLKDSRFAEADVVVVDNQFAVKIKQIVGAATAQSETQQ